VAALINTHDPEVVVLGGSVMDASRGLLLDIARETARAAVFDAEARSVRIEASTLGSDAGAMGAAALVFGRLHGAPTLTL